MWARWLTCRADLRCRSPRRCLRGLACTHPAYSEWTRQVVHTRPAAPRLPLTRPAKSTPRCRLLCEALGTGVSIYTVAASAHGDTPGQFKIPYTTSVDAKPPGPPISRRSVSTTWPARASLLCEQTRIFAGILTGGASAELGSGRALGTLRRGVGETGHVTTFSRSVASAAACWHASCYGARPARWVCGLHPDCTGWRLTWSFRRCNVGTR